MAIALNLHGKSDAYIRGYLQQAARYDKKNCKPGKTIQCGNVCRKPENCKKTDEKLISKSKNKPKSATSGTRETKEKSFVSQINEGVAAYNATPDDKKAGAFGKYEESILDTKLGQILRIPQKFIKTKKSGMSSQQIDAIASEMKKRGKNVTPVMIKKTGEDKYEVVQGGQIIEAARKAKLDFVWTIIVDDDMARQMAIESGLS